MKLNKIAGAVLTIAVLGGMAGGALAVSATSQSGSSVEQAPSTVTFTPAAETSAGEEPTAAPSPTATEAEQQAPAPKPAAAAPAEADEPAPSVPSRKVATTQADEPPATEPPAEEEAVEATPGIVSTVVDSYTPPPTEPIRRADTDTEKKGKAAPNAEGQDATP